MHSETLSRKERKKGGWEGDRDKERKKNERTSKG